MRGESGLSKAQREMIAVVVSAANRCHYCIVSHSAALRKLTGDPDLVDRLATGWKYAELDVKERAMLDRDIFDSIRSARLGHKTANAAGVGGRGRCLGCHQRNHQRHQNRSHVRSSLESSGRILHCFEVLEFSQNEKGLPNREGFVQ